LSSLWFVVHGALRVPLSEAAPLFIAESVLYEISVGGIIMVTFTGHDGAVRFAGGPVLVTLDLPPGSATPLESMLDWLIEVIKIGPTLHFVSFSGPCFTAPSTSTSSGSSWPPSPPITMVNSGVSLMRYRTQLPVSISQTLENSVLAKQNVGLQKYSRLSCRRLLVKQIFVSILLPFAVCGWIAGMATPRPPPACADGRDCRQ
jgi:hypothetical protein